MKKKALLFSLIAGMGYVILSSSSSGPINGGAGNLTGAKGSTASCGGCHSGGSGTPTLNIRVDTAGGVEVTKYTPGKTYTVTVTGSHSSLTNFGFQYTAVSGTGAAQINAGTFSALASQTASRTASSLNIIEHTSTISGSLSKSFTWTAPATAVGNVTMYLTVNAVNGNGNTGGDISGSVNKVLTAYAAPSTVADITNEISINAFPNPTTSVLNIQATNIFGNYNVEAFDFMGRSVMNTTVNGIATISTANWAAGVYNVVVTGETGRKTIQVVKQ